MKLISQSFDHNGVIPQKYALGRSDIVSKADFAQNISPHLQWTGAPEGTKSFALVCVNPDAPSDASDVNQPDKVVPADLPRADFYHWAMINIPATMLVFKEGEWANGLTRGGKEPQEHANGIQQGINSYTDWFAGDFDLQGDYYGYDGPFPPWNDAIIHHYHFKLFALDVAELDLSGKFTGADVVEAVLGHVLGEAELIGTYAINDEAVLIR